MKPNARTTAPPPLRPRVLVTGGAGFIGSHTCVALIEAGYLPVVLDSLVNSDARSLHRVACITGVEPVLVRGDVRDAAVLDRVFAEHAIGAVVHLAGLKAVGESVADPVSYYDVNLAGTLALVKAMARAGVRTLVFSSSATVYGDAQLSPFQRPRLALPSIRTAAPSRWSRPSCATWPTPTRAGASPACATSIRWARTRAACSASARTARPTT